MEKTLRTLLEAIRAGELTIDEGVERVRNLAFEDMGFANVDHHRQLRRGFPEVVLAQGKTCKQVTAIVARMLAGEGNVLVTRAEEAVAAALLAAHPGGEHNELGRTVLWRRARVVPGRTRGKILVISAGTSDIPVAEEAAATADAFGNEVNRLYDVGVAGIHRLLGHGEKLRAASVLIVVAGMEGALASVVGGLTDVPVIAVPTSIGYGASFGGIAALLAMLNSCASGVTVVNIDNGFGAGCAASLINRMLERRAGEPERSGAREAADAVPHSDPAEGSSA
jgi:NCAIR mutase (PurE)-related protein